MSNIVAVRSEDLAVRIVNLYKYLCNEKGEYVMSKQLLRAGTSIGANIAESQNAQSNADFIAKMHIALKECSECRYWIRLLWRTEYMSDAEFSSIAEDVDEVYAILTSILKTLKNK